MIDLEKKKYGYSDLLAILEVLRGENGCPWDAEQTHQSIRRDFVEEAYEVAEAIDLADDAMLCEELGDVLLNVAFHASIAKQRGAFDMEDVCDGICRKMIHRHPHVFADVKAETSAQVLDSWEQIKRSEKAQSTYSEAMEQVAKSLPALIYAEKIQKKARKAGFDWPDASGALDKIREETCELMQAAAASSNTEEELGDLLFSVVNAARFLKVDPEQALIKSTRKFINRFTTMEVKAGSLEGMPLEQLDKLWDQAKEKER